MNFTVLAPKGTTNHGDPRVICTPPKWHDYIVFFATNYFIHAATLPTRPGESTWEVIFAVVNALFVPGFGALRVINRLVLLPALRRDRLHRAAAAGALCMVIKEEYLGKNNAHPSNTWLSNTFKGQCYKSDVLREARIVHGQYRLPSQFCLVEVPRHAKLKRFAPKTDLGVRGVTTVEQQDEETGLLGQHSDPETETASKLDRFEIGGKYSVVKVLVALVQLMAGILTLYHARADQLDRYGYGAFGLSVIPYVFMSLVNIIAMMACPEYATMYLVHTPSMDEAEALGGHFDGVVAKLVVYPEDTSQTSTFWWDQNLCFFSGFILFGIVIVAPVAVVAALSGFRAGESTSAQRAWLMSWLLVGSISSIWVWTVRFGFDFRGGVASLGEVLFCFFILLPIWVPAVGGMVTVGLALKDYGICSRVGD